MFPTPPATQQVNPAFLSFFNRAMNLQRALYTGAPGQIQFKYALRPHPTESVGSLTMNIDGQALTYNGGNARLQAVYVARDCRTGRHADGEDYRWVGIGIPELRRNLGSLPLLCRC